MPEAAERSPAAPQSSAQPGVFSDPYRAYNFKLVIQGVTEGHFTDCTDMSIKIDALRYREGGQGQIVHRIPGQLEYGDISLRYGLTSSLELWNWLMTGVKGKVERKNVSIVMLDGDGVTEVLRWNLVNAWVSEWRGAPLGALTRQLAIESITIVFATLERG